MKTLEDIYLRKHELSKAQYTDFIRKFFLIDLVIRNPLYYLGEKLFHHFLYGLEWLIRLTCKFKTPKIKVCLPTFSFVSIDPSISVKCLKKGKFPKIHDIKDNFFCASKMRYEVNFFNFPLVALHYIGSNIGKFTTLVLLSPYLLIAYSCIQLFFIVKSVCQSIQNPHLTQLEKQINRESITPLGEAQSIIQSDSYDTAAAASPLNTINSHSDSSTGYTPSNYIDSPKVLWRFKLGALLSPESRAFNMRESFDDSKFDFLLEPKPKSSPL